MNYNHHDDNKTRTVVIIRQTEIVSVRLTVPRYEHQTDYCTHMSTYAYLYTSALSVRVHCPCVCDPGCTHSRWFHGFQPTPEYAQYEKHNKTENAKTTNPNQKNQQHQQTQNINSNNNKKRKHNKRSGTLGTSGTRFQEWQNSDSLVLLLFAGSLVCFGAFAFLAIFLFGCFDVFGSVEIFATTVRISDLAMP